MPDGSGRTFAPAHKWGLQRRQTYGADEIAGARNTLPRWIGYPAGQGHSKYRAKLMLALHHRAVDLALGVFRRNRVALVILLLAVRQADLDLGAVLPQVNARGHQRETLLLEGVL